MNTTTPAVPRPGQLPRMHDDLPAWSARARLASNDPALQDQADHTRPMDDQAAEHRLDDMASGVPMDDMTHTLMRGAMRLGEEVADRRAYREGWWWGFTCGGFAIGLLLLIGINTGRMMGWWLA